MKSSNEYPLKQFLLVSFFLAMHFCGQARDLVYIEKSNQADIKEREAIVILTGLGSMNHSAKEQIKRFKNKGYDLFIPDYISRKSLTKNAENFEMFHKKHNLGSYKKVHVFCYLVGGWTLNMYLSFHKWENLSSIVFDRSPLQETIPGILVRENPIFSKILFGEMIKDFASTPYKSANLTGTSIGLLIECKATELLWKKQVAFMKLPKISFEVDSLHQSSSDYFYTYSSHDDLYTDLDEISTNIFTFFKEGKFPVDASRVPIARDPFEPYLEH